LGESNKEESKVPEISEEEARLKAIEL